MNLPIVERHSKTPDHICRQKLLNATVTGVEHHIDTLAGRDTLCLALDDGTTIEIEAERLYLDLRPAT